jgi:hypothetical protein
VARKWSHIDPDSLAGKLWLLLFDKIVLGAVIAVAFLGYERWKTVDQRTYDDKVTLAFQRANYIKELVPIVSDSKQDVSVRAMSLIALIETRSIGDSSALALSERLLKAGLIRSDYPERFRWNRRHPLLDALQSRMPAGLDAFLQQYMTHMASASNVDRSREDVGNQHDADEFWSELFYSTVEQNTDSDLSIMDSVDFLNKYLWVMDRLVGLVEGETRQRLGREWFTRNPKGIRLLAALRGIGDVGRTQHAAALVYILDLITPISMTDSNLRLADQLIHLVQERGWPSKALATRCVEIMLHADADSRIHPEAFSRELACSGYLGWYANSQRDSSDRNAEGDGSAGWVEIEPAVASALASYLARVSKEQIDLSEYSNGRSSIARPLAEILIAGVEKGQKPSAATLQVMATVLSLSDTNAHALILEDLRPRWIAATKKISPAAP